MKIVKNKHILYLFLLSSILLVMDIFLYWNYKISFAGFYTDCVVFWMWILSFLGGIIVYWRKLMAKISLGVFVLGIIFSFFLFPFFIFSTSILLSTTPMGLHFEKKINDKYRFQVATYSLMGKDYGVIIENKFGVFEQELQDKKDRMYYIQDIKFISEDQEFIYLKPYYKEGKEVYESDDIIKINKH